MRYSHAITISSVSEQVQKDVQNTEDFCFLSHVRLLCYIMIKNHTA